VLGVTIFYFGLLSSIRKNNVTLVKSVSCLCVSVCLHACPFIHFSIAKLYILYNIYSIYSLILGINNIALKQVSKTQMLVYFLRKINIIETKIADKIQ
jgi:hypothetical protein